MKIHEIALQAVQIKKSLGPFVDYTKNIQKYLLRKGKK